MNTNNCYMSLKLIAQSCCGGPFIVRGSQLGSTHENLSPSSVVKGIRNRFIWDFINDYLIKVRENSEVKC